MNMVKLMVTVPMPVGENITSRELTPFEQVKTSSWEYTPLRPSRQWGGIRLSWTEKQSNKKAIFRTIMQNNATNVTELIWLVCFEIPLNIWGIWKGIFSQHTVVSHQVDSQAVLQTHVIRSLQRQFILLDSRIMMHFNANDANEKKRQIRINQDTS